MRKHVYIVGLILAVLITVITATPVLAAYYVSITVTESDGNSYDMLPVAASIDIDYLADHGFIGSDGRDVRVKTIGGAEVPFMLVDDKVLFAASIDNDQDNAFRLSTGNSLIDDFSIVTGYGGYITTADHANLEPADDFEIEFDGYIDTSPVYDYPTVESTATSEDDGTTHDIDLPSGIEAGDLLLICFAAYDDDSTRTLTWPAGWTSLVNESDDKIVSGVAYRIATGSESSPVTATTDGNCESVHHSYRITGYTGVPEAATTTTTVNDEYPNPPSLTTSWSAKTLWLAGFSGGQETKKTLSAIPTDYTDELYTVTTSSSVADYAHIGSARREYNYMTDDPDRYTLSANIRWLAWTVAICGDHIPIVTKDGAITIVGTNGDIEATMYDSPTKTVTATVDNDEYTVIVGADSTDLYIKIDGDTKDTEALSGASVPDNANDWILELPYCNYYRLTTADTLRLTYEPDDIIDGTTLSNELDAGTYDGTITYGSEPSGVAVSISGLETYETSYPTDAAGSQDIISPTTAALFDVDLERLAHNPLQPIVALIADEANLTERLVWLAFGFFCLFATLILVLWKSEGQLTFTAFAGMGVCVIMYVLGIFPLWITIVFAFGAVAALIWERVIAL